MALFSVAAWQKGGEKGLTLLVKEDRGKKKREQSRLCLHPTSLQKKDCSKEKKKKEGENIRSAARPAQSTPLLTASRLGQKKNNTTPRSEAYSDRPKKERS